MKKAFALALWVLALALPLPAARADDKIGIVDFQHIIDESKAGKAAKSKLQTLRDAEGTRMRNKEESLMKKLQELDAQRAVLSSEAFQKRQAELARDRDQFQEDLQKAQGDLRETEQSLMKGILDDVQGIVKELAEKESFTLVLEKGAGILYALPKYDLTDRVLSLYDGKTAKSTPAPTPEKKK
jgi:outer membrane protein